jgi:uncharacterized protein
MKLMQQTFHWLVASVSVAVLMVAGAATAGAASTKLAVEPALESPRNLDMEFGGFLGKRLKANMENWELRVPGADPALTEMFYDRDRAPSRDLLPWSGEFIGKYLCASILSYRLLKDPRQKANIDREVRAFLDSQDTDGYLGPFSKSQRLTGQNTWDMWGHYWAIRALLLYHQEFGSQEALQAATRAADLLIDTFLDKGIAFTNDGSFGQMNYSVIHAFTQLYELTGTPRYLAMANWVVKQWELPGAGQYLTYALAGKEMFEFPGKRWESVHDFLGMADMYLLTGDPKYRQAFTHIWQSILKGDRHNTGGFTSGEETTGNPYNKRQIETCCTVAWIDMTLSMLRLTGDSRVADELELAAFNGNLGGQNPSGNWWTYNTPMDGTREASAHRIHFQCRAGSPDLNCCSVNGPRGMGLVAEWALMSYKRGLALNYYGPSRFVASTPSGQRVSIKQTTDYPVSGDDTLQLSLARPETFDLRLRIPAWSTATRVSLNGENLAPPQPGEYLSLPREWKDGDTLKVQFDMTLHYWVGDRECQGLTSIYRGPLLLAFDPVYNTVDPDAVPGLDAKTLRPVIATTNRTIQPWVLVKVRALNGQDIELCDFATAGAYGNYYRSWLPVRGIDPIPFSLDKPIWNNRPH